MFISFKTLIKISFVSRSQEITHNSYLEMLMLESANNNTMLRIWDETTTKFSKFLAMTYNWWVKLSGDVPLFS